CACPRTSTSWGCSTASTSGCRSTRSASARGCWLSSSRTAEASGGAAHADDLAAQHHLADPSPEDPHAEELPAAVLGVLGQRLPHLRATGVAPEGELPELVLHHGGASIGSPPRPAHT